MGQVSEFRVQGFEFMVGRAVMRGERLRHPHVQRFRGGLVFKAQMRLYHLTLGLKVIQKTPKQLCEDGAL